MNKWVIPDEFYGKWIEAIENRCLKRPVEKDFNLPTTKDECVEMLSMMSVCGIDKASGMAMLRERKERFELAVKEYESKKDQEN